MRNGRKKENLRRTGGILAVGNLDEVLDVGDFGRHGERCDGQVTARSVKSDAKKNLWRTQRSEMSSFLCARGR